MKMALNDRGDPRCPAQAEEASTLEIQRLLDWITAAVRAERTFPWYRACVPSRLIARCRPGLN